MKFLLHLLVSALSVMGASYLLSGVSVSGFGTALLVAVVLGLLNAVVRPLLIVLTLPVTFLTLGLFLLVINVIIVYMASGLVPGFRVDGFVTALLFSLLVSLFSAVLGALLPE